MKFIRNIQRAVGIGVLAAAATAFAQVATPPNPHIPNYGWGSIVADPHYPIVGETTTVSVQVSNNGDEDATDVQVKVSFNDWGVTFMGWQEMGTVTIPTLAAGATTTVTVDHVFQTRTHTCVEAVIISPTDPAANSNPSDDRGQINLEVIHAGETFSYDVPIVNNGDVPLQLDVVVRCEKRDPAGDDGTLPPGPCREDLKKIDLLPGEEMLIPVHLGLRAGEVVDLIVEAIDRNDPDNRNNIRFRIINATARMVKKNALGVLNGVIAGMPKGNVKNQLEAQKKALEKALNSKAWLDGNHLGAGGAEVFAADRGIVQKLLALMGGDMDREDKISLDEVVRGLVDSDRILANLAPGVDRADLRDGDADREAGEYARAVNGYKHAWQGTAE